MKKIKCVCGSENITTREVMRRCGGPKVGHKLMSYGYYLNVHMCLDCNNVWDGEKIKK